MTQTVEMAAGVAPLILMGLPVEVAAALALAVAIHLLLQHSNAEYRIGPAKYLLALNEGRASTTSNGPGSATSTSGCSPLIWEHLFRACSYDPQRRFASEHLGMAAKPNYPVGYLDQLVYPFTTTGGCHHENDTAVSTPAVADVPHR